MRDMVLTAFKRLSTFLCGWAKTNTVVGTGSLA